MHAPLPAFVEKYIPLFNMIKTSLFALALLACTASAAEPRFAPEQLREDLAVLERTLAESHPRLSHSVEPQALADAVRTLAGRLSAPMARDEAWAAFATLNPLLADGHLFVALQDWRGEAGSHLAAGGRFFPFEVTVGVDGAIRVVSLLGGAATPLAGARIASVNGHEAGDVARDILARAHGDTPSFRAELASRRFWFYHWKLFGAPASYAVTFADAAPANLPGSSATPRFLADEAAFERQFTFELLAGRAALLTVGTFDWPEKEEFLAFTREAFTRLRKAGTQTLVIDVRANGGGDDDFWIEGILPYIATSPYRWASAYEKRVLEEHRDAGETVGSVVAGPLDRWIQPEPDNPLRFGGEVAVLVGRSTYSAAILFSNVVQDFGFGRVAGTGGNARASQSGGVQRTLLPNTGFAVYWPRFILVRPSGAAEPALFEPDIPVEDDPLRPRAAVEELLKRMAPVPAQATISASTPRSPSADAPRWARRAAAGKPSAAPGLRPPACATGCATGTGGRAALRHFTRGMAFASSYRTAARTLFSI
jgi:hypothetical protein